MFELLGVTAGYGDTIVLTDVTVRVPPGSIVALLGPNGAGKTTLLRVASGLLQARSGELRCDGERLRGCSPHHLVRAGVCHVPEGRGIFRSMSVRDNLLLQAPAGSERSAVDQACEVFPALGRRLAQPAGTLSGGEQQMLALARAYVSNPSYVLLDEVSLGLAPIIVDQIFEFLVTLAEAGAGLLLVEQYVVRALRAADYVYVLTRGQIVFAGEPGELDEDQVFRSYVGAEV